MTRNDEPTREIENRSTDDGLDERFDTPQAPSLGEDDGLEATQLFEDDSNEPGFAPEEFVCPFGKYRLLEMIGKGGAGIVYRAEPLLPGPDVEFFAIKFLRPEVLTSRLGVQRFRKESRVHAEIDSPFVTKHLDFGQFKDSYFIVSEFVDGTSVNEFCSADSKTSPQLALLITRDLLRGLNALHQASIVHRDVKPGNVIASFEGATRNESSFKHAKLTDFGLARHIEQSASMEMTRQQTILGTPLYMAPEQYLESRSVDARADIYSTGATLYHLIAGRPPLEGDSMAALSELHRVERPASLHSLNPNIGEAVSNLVAKALEKNPELRYQDANDMLRDVELILEDRPISLRPYPAIPQANDPAARKFNFQWELNAAISDLWPLVADTNRFNRAIGLPSPEFTYDHSGEVRKIFAEAKFNGMRVRWQEHPFQWVREREMSVLREFETGPFEWMTSTVELSPLAGNRTRVAHRFQVKPRGFLGRLIVPLQFGWLTKRSLDRVYRRLEQLANDANPLACELPFGKPIQLSAKQEQALEDKTRMLKRDQNFVEIADQLSNIVRTAADPQVARICPVPLARKLNCDIGTAMNACLGAVDVGMFNLSWDVICPVCRVASQTKNSLKSIQSHAHCDVCNLDFDVDFARSVELIFSVHPSLRTVELATYCIGGPFHAPHIIAQNQLKPGEKVDVGAALATGNYGLKSRQLNSSLQILVDEDAVLKRVDIELGKSPLPDVPKLAPGNVCVAMDNQSAMELEVRLEVDPSARDSISAAEASAHPMFRKLFPNDQISFGDLVDVSSVFVLMIQLADADQQIELVGDMQNRNDWNSIREILCAGSDVPIVENTESHLIIAFETAERVIESLGNLLIATRQNTETIDLARYSVAVHLGQIMTGIDPNQPGVFGKAVREVKTLMSQLSASQWTLCREVVEATQFESLQSQLIEQTSEPESQTQRFNLKSS